MKALIAFSGSKVIVLEQQGPTGLHPVALGLREKRPVGGVAVLEDEKLRDLTPREWACLEAGVSIFEGAPIGPCSEVEEDDVVYVCGHENGFVCASSRDVCRVWHTGVDVVGDSSEVQHYKWGEFWMTEDEAIKGIFKRGAK